MQTLKLNISDNIYDKLIQLLNVFDKSELEIIHTNSNFKANQNYLNNELANIKSGNAVFISEEDLNIAIENAITKHED